MDNINPNNRIIALDAFRGFTVAGMMIVNNPGSWNYLYPPLGHAEWHGVTPTDFIFPFFLFIVGISITLAYTKRLTIGTPRNEMIIKILKRSAIIFGLGLFLSFHPRFDFMQLRIPGVLQRIAVVFMACSILFLNSNWKTQAKTAAALLIAYWMLMAFVPTPGYDRAMLEPGQNLASWLDSIIIPLRMFRGTWDPEGLLSTLPAIATGITGMLVGKLIISDLNIEKRVSYIFLAGFLSLALGEAWGWIFPLNKHIWTSSYVLYTSGLGALMLASMILIIDVFKLQKWTQFGIIYGSNSITIFVLAGILPTYTSGIKNLIFNGLINAGFAPELASLIWAIIFCLICFIPALVLYRKKIFIKV